MVRDMVLSKLLTYEYASYFENKTFEELDELATSFKIEHCLRRDGLNKILQHDAETNVLANDVRHDQPLEHSIERGFHH